MKVKYIVDDINESKTLGRTKSIDKILYNVERFSSDFHEILNKSFEKGLGVTCFTIVGRFIVYFSINCTKSKGELIFFDTELNLDKALDTIKVLFSDNKKFQDAFMKKYSELENVYQSDYYLAEIAVYDAFFN